MVGLPLTILPTSAVHAAVLPARVLPAATAQTEAFDEATAAGLAKSLGHRIEVSGLRSETDQVFKNPDGTSTREQHLEPVRVHKASGWLPVDSTLTRAADGSLVPAASAVDMVFSAGGTGPLVAVGHNGVGFSLTWPTPLPAPSVSGDTATYPEVYPGVDLTLTAVGTSFTEHMIVKTVASGRLPAVRSLTLGTQVTGGKLVPAAGGGFTVVDLGGQAAWSSPAPLMWDSSADASATSAVTPMGITTGGGAWAAVSRLGQDGAREGDKVMALGQQIGAGSMLLTADASLLDSATTRYPVIIDPITQLAARYNWAMVDLSYPTTAYYNFADSDQGVGHYADQYGVDTKRLFFGFTTTPFFGKTIRKAILYMRETYSGACTAGTVDAYLTGSVTNTGAMTWNTQAARASGILDSFSVKAGRSDCLPGGSPAEFDVTSGIQSRVTSRYVVSTIGLAGRSETTNSSWMRFAGPKNATLAYQPYLSVEYNTVPNIPSTSTMRAPGTGNACATTVEASTHLNQTLPSSSQYATASDADGGNLQMTFTLFNAKNVHQNDRATNWLVTNPGVGAVFPLKIPTSWGDGSYYWVAQAHDGMASSDASGKCFITLDSKAPAAPALTSTLVPDTLYTPGTIGNFTMATPDAAAFVYSWNGGPKTTVAPNTTEPVPSAPLTTMPAWKGDISLASFSAVGTLTVYAVDAAGNRSEDSPAFYVRKEVGEKVAQYLFEDPRTNAVSVGADTAVDPTAAPHKTFHLDITSNVSWEAGRYASVPTCLDTNSMWTCPSGENLSRSFSGASGAGEAVSSEPPVLSAHSFTIGAWIKLSDKDQPRTIIAQNLEAPTSSGTGSGIAAYDIGYEQSTNRFVFEVTPTVGAPVTAFDALPKTTTDQTTHLVSEWHSGAWVYLAAIYDEAAGTIRLDTAHERILKSADPMNPHLAVQRGAPAFLPPSMAVKAGLGPFRVGGGAGRAPWSGLVDNVSVWQQALSDSDSDDQVLFNVEDKR